MQSAQHMYYHLIEAPGGLNETIRFSTHNQQQQQMPKKASSFGEQVGCLKCVMLLF